ncbi:hypothetical protein FACS1894196_4450 [Clostridia bacterium]|nr:hypothetical protein FACS1894196_4450 [Clostridia bacterium]
MGCTLVIVSMHWGREEHATPTAEQLKLGPALMDAGADIVFGHGPHVLQPMEIYGGKPILYSLANFVFGANANPKDSDTAVITLVYTITDGVPALQTLTAYPAKMHSGGDYRPYPLTEPDDRARVLGKLYFDQVKNKKMPTSGLPESFLETGVANF